MNFTRAVVAALVAFIPLSGACRRRTESTRPPGPAASAVASESASAKSVEAQVGDVVDIAASAQLAATPGGSAFTHAASSPALVIGSGGGGFRRVLLADGTSGWTAAPLRTLSSARMHPQANLELERFPPGDPRRKETYGPAAVVVLPAHAMASVAGASFELDAPDPRALRLDQAPFLEQPNLLLQIDPTTTGFVHGLEIDLEWTAPPFVELAALPGVVRGIVRRPFLSPFTKAALAVAPRAGDVTHVLHGFDPFGALPAPAHKWASLETLVHDPTAKPGAIATLAVVADGGAFAFVFAGSKKSESLVLPRRDLGSPWVTRVVTADLDGDGLSEWLVEIVDRTSEALEVRLLIVAGSSLQSTLSGAPLELGGESGEGDDPGQRHAWYVDGHQLFVARDGAVRGMCESLSVVGSLPVYDSPPPKLAVAKSFADAAPARADAFSSTDGRQALPVTIGGKPRWVTGRCFRNAADAKAWAARAGGHVL
ncbi:MAG: hypothetical protein ACXVEF_16525 [Polyangiales bacterium]